MSDTKLLLRTALGEKSERPPVWLMRQAGRILPPYRAIREKLGNFKDLVKNPALAAEVTLQPVTMLGVDAAIIFSDILVLPEAMGLDYQMIESQGPFFPKTIQNKADIDHLHAVQSGDLAYVTAALELTKKQLDPELTLIGFAGAPWTIFCYMIEGKGSKTFSKAKKMLYTAPILAHQLLEKITLSTIVYVQDQIKAGAELIQIFDSWADALSPELYQIFALPYLEKIKASIEKTPMTLFAKGAQSSLESIGKTAYQVIGLDWQTDVATAKKLIPKNKVLQGNLDPCALYADKKNIEISTRKMLDQFADRLHIANLGHGLYPDTDWQKVKYFVEIVKSYKPKINE